MNPNALFAGRPRTLEIPYVLDRIESDLLILYNDES